MTTTATQQTTRTGVIMAFAVAVASVTILSVVAAFVMSFYNDSSYSGPSTEQNP